jgi:hypothetical protein
MYNSANHLASLCQTPCELLKTCKILRSHCGYCKFKSSRMWNFVFRELYSSYVMEAACFSEAFYGTRRFITAFKSTQASLNLEPDQSSPCFPITPLEDPFLHYPPIQASLRSLHEKPLRTSPVSHTCYTTCQFFFLIRSPA